MGIKKQSRCPVCGRLGSRTLIASAEGDGWGSWSCGHTELDVTTMYEKRAVRNKAFVKTMVYTLAVTLAVIGLFAALINYPKPTLITLGICVVFTIGRAIYLWQMMDER